MEDTRRDEQCELPEDLDYHCPTLNLSTEERQKLAEARPALCYCSVLVRALLAVQFSHWQSHTTSSLVNHPEQTKNTVRVLELMAIGQFTPPQLSLVPDIIHIFDPFQLHCVITGTTLLISDLF